MIAKPPLMATTVPTRVGGPQTGTARGPSHPGTHGPQADPANMGQRWQGSQATPATAHGTVPFKNMPPLLNQCVLLMSFLLALFSKKK